MLHSWRFIRCFRHIGLYTVSLPHQVQKEPKALLSNKASWYTKMPKKSHSKESSTRKVLPKITVGQMFSDDITDDEPPSSLQSNEKRKENKQDHSTEHNRKGTIDEMYNTIVSEGKCQYLSVDQWDDIGKNVSHIAGLAKMWPFRLLDSICFKPKSEGIMEMAQSLNDYLQYKRLRISPLSLKVGQMHLLLNQLGEEASEEVCTIYDELKREYGVFDAFNLSRIISGLCQTRRWEECVELLDMYRITALVGTAQYSPIVAAAFKYGSDDKAYNLMQKMHEDMEQPLDVAYLSLLKRGSIGDIERLLSFLKHTEWFISGKVIEELETFFQSQSEKTWSTHHMLIKKSPDCQHCGQPIEPLITLSDNEFGELQNTFMEKSLIKSDIFQNTSPEEFASFQKFLAEKGPFDVVIDGLNTAHGTHQKAKTAEKANLLIKVVEHFAVHKKKKVLMLGKIHMKTWPRNFMAKIEGLAECFLTNNSSEDDTFVLYAALSSGPNTQFVTRDEFRDHRTLLGPKLAQRFKHWQLSRQIPFLGQYNERSQKKQYLSFKWPNVYHTRVHQTPYGWHIPYDDGEERASYQVPNTWLCVKRT